MASIAGFELDLSRRYAPAEDLWLTEMSEGVVRIGLDPLGAQSAGDLIAVSFAAVGAELAAGETFATIEAAKFVGPLRAPVAGAITAVNANAWRAPARISADPLGVWLVELRNVGQDALDALLYGEPAVRPWFESAVARARSEGVLAE
jgi:glycine cleavage system H protein